MGCLEWILLHLQVSTDSNFSCVGPIKESHCKIILENSMHKENFGNHMEDYICVGFFIMSMIIQKLILRIHKSCILCYQELVIGINSRIQAKD